MKALRPFALLVLMGIAWPAAARAEALPVEIEGRVGQYIALLKDGSSRQCTAFLLDDKTIVTEYHCIDPHQKKACFFLDKAAHTLQDCRALTGSDAEARRNAYLVEDSHEPDCRRDISILKRASGAAPVATVGPMPMADKEKIDPEAAYYMVHYPSKNLVMQGRCVSRCRISASNGDWLNYACEGNGPDCAGEEEGSSGAPIFDGAGRLAGVNEGSGKASGVAALIRQNRSFRALVDSNLEQLPYAPRPPLDLQKSNLMMNDTLTQLKSIRPTRTDAPSDVRILSLPSAGGYLVAVSYRNGEISVTQIENIAGRKSYLKTEFSEEQAIGPGLNAIALRRSGSDIWLAAGGTVHGRVGLFKIKAGEKGSAPEIAKLAPECVMNGETSISDLAFSPVDDGKALELAASGRAMHAISRWKIDPGTGSCTVLDSFPTQGQATGVAYGRDGTLAATTSKGTLQIAHPGEKALSTLGKRRTAQTRRPRWNADGTLVAVPGSDYLTQVWQCADGACRRIDAGSLVHCDNVRAVAFDPDGRLFTAGSDGCFKIWDLQKTPRLSYQATPGYTIKAMDLSADGQLLAVAVYDSNVYLFRMNGNKL